MPTRRVIHRTALRADRGLDRRRRFVPSSGVGITPYRGLARLQPQPLITLTDTPARPAGGGEMLVRGRVLLLKNITRATEAEPLWRNVLNTYRRFQSAEVAGARVQASYGSVSAEGLTDNEGHFRIRLDADLLDPDQLWHEVALELPDSGATALSHVILPPAGAAFGIISDIDDTIVQTGATSLLRMARSLMANAATRLPFDGVADLYTALHGARNPIFYVSSSPWNLYELLHDFMDLNGIPPGPMFLQDWGIDEHTFIIASHEKYKLDQIQKIVDYYPHLPFVLIGDSGQHDPEIYLQVIRTHPGRILAAFIRDVTHDLRDRAVAQIIDEAATAGVEMLYVEDSGEALEHAERLGLIATE
jgi:phosphatidate phosphatase APP1